MSRAIPVCLLASALFAFIGCGGGEATDSGTVAENSGAAASASGGEAAMPSSSGGMEAPSGGTAASSSSMEGMTGMAPGMNAEMYGAGGAGTGTSDPAATTAMEGMMPGGAGYPGGDAATGVDSAAMAESYGAAGEGYPGASGDPAAGATAEAMEAGYAGAGAEGAAAGEYPGGIGGPGGGAVEEKIPEGFDGKAQLAFRRGKEKDAMQYLYAHALTTDAGAESLLPTIRWVGGLKQPMLAVRWGVGFVVTAPRNFEGDPKPVGSNQNIPTRGGARDGGGGNEGYVGGGGGGEYGAGGDGGGGKNEILSKGAGELGEKLTAAYTERVMLGDFGEVLKKAIEDRNAGSRGDAGGGGAYGSGGEGEVGGADFSNAGAGGPGGLGRSSGGAGGAAAGASATKEVTQLMPGLSILGIGTQKEVIDRAREDGINAVVIFDVKLRVSAANGLVTNDSTLALFDAKTQKKLHTTKMLNNINIQKARAEEKEDGVDKEFENLFAAIDAKLKMTDLPAGLNADIATKRVAALAAEKHDNPLPILVEARMYHSKGLLEESKLFAAYEQILGVDSGRLLATGTEEDKKKVLDQWLPER